MTSAGLNAQAVSLSITVDDLKQAMHYFVTGLGFEVEEEYQHEGVVRGAMLTAGAARLGVSQENFAQGRDRVKGLGTRLYIETTNDIVALAARARAAGIKLDAEPAPLPWGPMGMSLTTPEGFKFTIANPR